MLNRFLHTYHQPLAMALLGIVLFCQGLILPGRAAEQAGNVTFSIPTGWHRYEQGPLTVLVPDAKAGSSSEAVLIILPGAALTTDFRSWFDETVKMVESTDKGAPVHGDLQVSKSQEGYPVITMPAVTQNPDGSQTIRCFVAAQPGNRAEMVIYLSTNLDAVKQYDPAFKSFIASLDFKNLHGQSTSPGLARTPANPTGRTNIGNPAYTQKGYPVQYGFGQGGGTTYFNGAHFGY